MKCNNCGETIEEVTVYEEKYKVYQFNKDNKKFEFKNNEPSQNKIIICNKCNREITEQLRDKI